MDELLKMLDQSRLAEVIEKAERGEDVDYNHVLTLQALDIARAGEVFAADTIRREIESDDRFVEEGKKKAGGAGSS